MTKPTRTDRESEEHRRIAKHLGTICKTCREALGMTRMAIAEQIGISKEFYGRIERGATLPGVQTLAALATVLNVSVDRLLGIEAGSAQPDEPPMSPELEELVAQIKQATPGTRRVVMALLKELRASDRKQRKPVP